VPIEHVVVSLGQNDVDHSKELLEALDRPLAAAPRV
jgi:hypothetical protein